MNNSIKIILIVVIIILIIYLIFNFSNNTSNNTNNNDNNNTETFDVDVAELPKNMDNLQYIDIASINSDDSTQILPSDLNHSLPGEYKQSNYADSSRGNMGPASWTSYFDQNNQIVDKVMGSKNEFMPLDETNQTYAPFQSNEPIKKDVSPEDMFDVNQYLPKNEKSDWWDNVEVPIDVKNRHLINLNRPIGVNTIGSSNRNSSYDIRGEPPNPKFVVSPWGNSSIDPKVPFKPLA